MNPINRVAQRRGHAGSFTRYTHVLNRPGLGVKGPWTRELVSAIRVRCSNIVHAWQAPLMPLVDSLDVDSNCYRGGGHRMSVMRILLPFCKKIPCAGRHSAAFG